MHQLADACLFGLSFWIANLLRVNPTVGDWFNLGVLPPDAFKNFVWLYFALIPTAPLVLESQGFYNRPMQGPRSAVLWPLFKGILIITFGLVLVMYVFHMVTPRGITVFFGIISF